MDCKISLYQLISGTDVLFVIIIKNYFNCCFVFILKWLKSKNFNLNSCMLLTIIFLFIILHWLRSKILMK